MAAKTFASVLSAFGTAAKAKLASPAITGAPEDQLRAPLEALIQDLAELAGYPGGTVSLIGETTLSHLKSRPDYAVTRAKALVGFIEIKAPGKGANPKHFPDGHDAEQWKKLKSLPNILYTDGNEFSLWRDGELTGKIVELDGDIESAGAKLKGPETLLALISDFLQWNPIAPKTPNKLAEISARLCRLLRDEVLEQVALGNAGLTALAQEWRHLLFPEANDAQFADGYAQAVTFGLLVARARGISLSEGIEPAAAELRKTSSLIGTALRLLTDDPDTRNALGTALDTLTRVLEAVDWHDLSEDKADAWLYFYEDFLEVYDKALRKLTGSYYTPPEVVAAMVKLVDEALRGPLFARTNGLAASDVTLADPAVGTGTFLLGVLRAIADSVAADQGEGAVPGAIAAAAKRLIGFELQFGPFAVAQLRIIAEMQQLMQPKKKAKAPSVPSPRLFITDTLGNPYAEETGFSSMVGAIAQSRKDANLIKRTEKITVVLGNPPYKNQAGGLGGWIENGSAAQTAPMDRWLPPPEWGVSANAHHLKNLYIYFWRWAAWKVFGAGYTESTGLKELDLDGIVCFITVAGFLNGPGFQKMRDDLRRICSDIWVIDCSPEGHQPSVNTRIFQGVQQPVCIVLAARKRGKDLAQAARVHFRALPKVHRLEKFTALEKISLYGPEWTAGAAGWREPFLPEHSGAWVDYLPLGELFVWGSPGVKTHRTWVIAPDEESLEWRWKRLQNEKDLEKKDVLFHSDRDRNLSREVKVAAGALKTRPAKLVLDTAPVIDPIRYAFRSFDRQWIIPDHRLLSMARPDLWRCYSPAQIFLTAPEDLSPTGGPPLSLTALMPDQHHYHGRGGRVYPLWRDAQASQSNIRPELLTFLAEQFGMAVSAEDVMAYIAALMAHPAFTARFKADLIQPGLRLPVTADGALFAEAAALGREVIWLHCYGERFADEDAGRPKGPPRMAKAIEPTIPAGGAIPGAPEPLPDTISYDPAKLRLHAGGGYVEHVTPQMWAYEVSGVEVVKHWFSYRKRDRSRPVIGDRRPPSPLGEIQPDSWPEEYTTDLLNLLRVLGRLIALEPAQADLLERICAGPLYSGGELSKLWTPAAAEVS